ncbi:YbaY family lipoprotein [Stutzerimonas azotifigens]|uniref:YbaY family lipoprotein n=1 Tax=Stutzerimonas azotifigens TaxID=291995 RepID=UPI00280A6117|nr:YbaY family lipoprotein [Stutzerimonas azotifigens]
MPLFPAVLSGLLLLLAGCASQPPEPPAAPPALEQQPAVEGKLLHELSGTLIGAPAGAEVELALLDVDHEQPDRLLANVKLNGRGTDLPFILSFNPETFAKSQRVELRGRVTQSGQLIMRLPARQIRSSASQALGPLRLEQAP